MTSATDNGGQVLRRRSGPSGYEYADRLCRPLGGLRKALSVLLPLYVIWKAVMLLVTLFWLADPRMFDAGALETLYAEEEPLLSMVLGIYALTAIGERLLFFICAFFVGRFTYRAMKNLYTARNRWPEMSPLGTVLWYFVPFANLVKPPQGLHEIYKGSLEEAGLAFPDGRISKWWAAWLVSVVAGALSNMSFASSAVVFVSVVIFTVSGALAAWWLRGIVNEIAETQEVMMTGGRASVFD